MQDGLPTESLWLMLYASNISDSDVEIEAQVQEPEEGEASRDVWGVGLEDILYMLENILGSEMLYFGNFWCISDLL